MSILKRTDEKLVCFSTIQKERRNCESMESGNNLLLLHNNIVWKWLQREIQGTIHLKLLHCQLPPQRKMSQITVNGRPDCFTGFGLMIQPTHVLVKYLKA
jgi:hypothetical protein